jgi:hypothetical protein
MAGLARTIYNPRPGELAGAIRDPAELCDPGLADRAAVESYLFDGFIPAAYRPGAAARWTAHHAQAWLEFLARHLEHTIADPDLAWWQLQRAVPSFVLAVIPGLTVGLLLGAGIGVAAGAAPGAIAAVAAWPAVGLLAWILASRRRHRTSRALPKHQDPARRSAWPAIWLGLALVALIVGAAAQIAVFVLFGLVSGAVSIWLLARIAYTPGSGIKMTPAPEHASRPETIPVAIKTAPSPRASLQRDHRAAIVRGLTLALVLGWPSRSFSRSSTQQPGPQRKSQSESPSRSLSR